MNSEPILDFWGPYAKLCQWGGGGGGGGGAGYLHTLLIGRIGTQDLFNSQCVN